MEAPGPGAHLWSWWPFRGRQRPGQRRSLSRPSLWHRHLEGENAGRKRTKNSSESNCATNKTNGYLVFSPMVKCKNYHQISVKMDFYSEPLMSLLLMCIAQKSTHSHAYCNTEYIQTDIILIAAKPQHLPSLLTKLQYSEIWTFLARSEGKWVQEANSKKVKVYGSLDLKLIFYFWLQATNNKEKRRKSKNNNDNVRKSFVHCLMNFKDNTKNKSI